MHILLIRHGIAENRDEWAKARRSDEDRPLTLKGRRKLRRGIRGLSRITPSLSVLVSSPLGAPSRARKWFPKNFRTFGPSMYPTLRLESRLLRCSNGFRISRAMGPSRSSDTNRSSALSPAG